MTTVKKFRIRNSIPISPFSQVAFEFGKYIFYFVEDEISMPIDNSVALDAAMRVTL